MHSRERIPSPGAPQPAALAPVLLPVRDDEAVRNHDETTAQVEHAWEALPPIQATALEGGGPRGNGWQAGMDPARNYSLPKQSGRVRCHRSVVHSIVKRRALSAGAELSHSS